MMVYVDISVFDGPASAYGVVSGQLDVPVQPAIGDNIALSFPTRDSNVEYPDVSGFGGHLRVQGRNLIPGEDASMIVELGELCLDSTGDARKVVTYLVEGFGLFFEPNSEDTDWVDPN